MQDNELERDKININTSKDKTNQYPALLMEDQGIQQNNMKNPDIDKEEQNLVLNRAASSFDEIQVGGGGGNQDFLSRMEEEINKTKELEELEEKKPLPEKIKSKNWKIRKNAYSYMLENLKSSQNFLDYVDLYPLLLDDQHASALESALEVVNFLFENYEHSSSLVSETFRVLLEKCLTSSRAVIKNKAKEIIIKSLEACDDSAQHMQVIISGLESKNLKTQMASLNLLTYLINQFGCFKIEYRSTINIIEKLSESNSANSAFRTEVLEFYKELFRWIKDSVKPYVLKLKDNLQKDLEKAFEELRKKDMGQILPPKFLKCDKNKTVDTVLIQSKMRQIKEEENLFKNSEAFDICIKFNEVWCEDLLAKERKWNEKKDMLELFLKESNVVKIKDSPRTHLTAAFLKLFKDSNINVVNYAILCVNNLAKGLRKDFIESKDYLLPLLEKFKEKKDKIVTDTFSSLDSIMTHCLTLEDCSEELISAFGTSNFSGNVNIKERFCVFLSTTLTRSYIPCLKKVAKPFAEILFKFSDDASPDVRNAALSTLGVLKYRVGEMLIAKVLNELCDIKKKKVDEASKNVTVDPIYEKDTTAKPNKQTISSNIPKSKISSNINAQPIIKEEEDVIMTDVNIENIENKTNNNFPSKFHEKDKPNNTNNIALQNDVEMRDISPNTDVLPLKKPNLGNRPKKEASKEPQLKSAPTVQEAEVEDDTNMNNEDIISIINDKLGSSTVELFNDTKWESRKNGFTALNEWCLSNKDEANKIVEVIMRFVKLKLKDYKENNINILKEALVIYHSLCENCSNFNKKHSSIIIKRFHEKIADNKLKQQLTNLLFTFMEYQGPKHITLNILKNLTNVKIPNVLKEFSSFLEKCIEDFGIHSLPVKEMVDFAKVLAAHANPQVRNGSTALICAMYKYVGVKLKKFLTDIKEATLKVIESELEKVQVQEESVSSNRRELKGQAAMEQTNSNNTIDNLFPKVDISKKITPKMIKELNEGKWQAKKEVLEALEKILNEANMRILPSGLNELITSLKNKLDDGNKNLVRMIVAFITKLVEALNKDAKLYAKTLITPVLKNLSDKMNLLREDVIKCLEKWSESIGFENVLVFCPAFLIIDNFELRTDLLKLILKNKTSLIKYDSKELIPGVLACLLDKMPSIRLLAEDLAREMLKIININSFYAAMKDYKPAIASTIRGVIEKYSSLICIDAVEIKTELNQNPNQNLNNNNEFKQPKAETQKVVNTGNNARGRNMSKNPKRESNSSNENESKEKNKKIVKQTSMPNIKQLNVNQQTQATQQTNLNQNSIKNSNNICPDEKPIPNAIPNVIPNVIITANIKINQKAKRLQAESQSNLSFPGGYITEEFDSNLKNQISQFFNKSFFEMFYSNDLNKFNILFSQIAHVSRTDPLPFYEITDILLKWILIKNLEMNTNHFFNNTIFDFFKVLIDYLTSNETSLIKIENKFLMEILVYKLFGTNSTTKTRAVNMMTDLCRQKLIKFDEVLEVFGDKFLLVFDMTMKIELLTVITNLGVVLEYKLDDKNLMNILMKIYESSLNYENLKTLAYNMVLEVYTKNDKYEDFLSIYLNKYIEFSSLIGKNKNFTSNDNQNTNIDIKSLGDKPSTSRIESKVNTSNINNISLPPQTMMSLSPLISVQKIDPNESKESLKLLDIMDQTKMDYILKALTQSEMEEKNRFLVELNDIFTNKYSECSHLLHKNIDNIILAFIECLNKIFLQPGFSEYSLEHTKYLLTVFYKAVLTKDVIENLTLNVIYATFESILKSILYENLERVGMNDEGKKIIKSLNALILKLMENLNPTLSLIALIKIIGQYRMDNSRICSLSIKCLLKISNIMATIINSIEIDKVLYAVYEFIKDFEGNENPELVTTTQNEEMCVKILRTVINELIKIKNEQIWTYYKMAIERNNLPDKHLRRWIQLILRSKNGLSMPGGDQLGSRGLPSKSSSTNLNSTSEPIPQDTLLTLNSLQNGLRPSQQNETLSIKTQLCKDIETELQIYISKLSNINPGFETEKCFFEIVAIIRRNNLPLESVKDKLSQFDFLKLCRLYSSITTESQNSLTEISNSNTNNLNNLNSSQNTGLQKKNITEFHGDKENITSNTPNYLVNSSNLSNVSNMAAKSLQDYKNKFQGISERSDRKKDYQISTSSPSPIKAFTNESSLNNLTNLSANYESRKQYMDNFMKTKEILSKKDHSINTLSNSITTQAGNSTNAYDKLNEMKKKLDELRTQKFN